MSTPFDAVPTFFCMLYRIPLLILASRHYAYHKKYSIPESREILELREWRRSRQLGMDFPMVNPAFKFSLILFLFALGIEVSLLG